VFCSRSRRRSLYGPPFVWRRGVASAALVVACLFTSAAWLAGQRQPGAAERAALATTEEAEAEAEEEAEEEAEAEEEEEEEEEEEDDD